MIGIIGAMDIEVDGIISQMVDKQTDYISGSAYTKGKIGGKECVVVKCGIGKVNAAVAAQTMILQYQPDMIINTGVGGSTSLHTHIGYVVIAENVIQHDMDTTAIGDKKGTLFLPQGNIDYIPCDRGIVYSLKKACDTIGETHYIIGTVATGDQFITGNDRRNALNTQFNALACEMEGGSIGQVCYLNEVPFGIIRAISDSMSEEDDAVEYSTFSKAAARQSINIIINFVKNSQ